jgi:hypothetical protein
LESTPWDACAFPRQHFQAIPLEKGSKDRSEVLDHFDRFKERTENAGQLVKIMDPIFTGARLLQERGQRVKVSIGYEEVGEDFSNPIPTTKE